MASPTKRKKPPDPLANSQFGSQKFQSCPISDLPDLRTINLNLECTQTSEFASGPVPIHEISFHVYICFVLESCNHVLCILSIELSYSLVRLWADVPIVHCSLRRFSSSCPKLINTRLCEVTRLWPSLKATQICGLLCLHRLCSIDLEPALLRLSRNWLFRCQQRYVLYPSPCPSYSFLADSELVSRTISRLCRQYLAQMAVVGIGRFEYLVPCLSLVNGLELENFIVAFISFSCSLSVLFLSCPPIYGIVVSFLLLSLSRKLLGSYWWTFMGPGELSLVYLVSSLNIIDRLLRILFALERGHKFNRLPPKTILSTGVYGSLKTAYQCIYLYAHYIRLDTLIIVLGCNLLNLLPKLNPFVRRYKFNRLLPKVMPSTNPLCQSINALVKPCNLSQTIASLLVTNPFWVCEIHNELQGHCILVESLSCSDWSLGHEEGIFQGCAGNVTP